MQITGPTSSPLSFVPAQSSSTTLEMHASDQVMMNLSPNTFSSFVKEASAQPEVRQDVVDSFKAKIASGHYPSQDIVEEIGRASCRERVYGLV